MCGIKRTALTGTTAGEMFWALAAGKDVWHTKNCINCHTILGEGAYYAPDLAKITKQRGEAYLTAFLKNPSDYYSEKKHRRVMPDLNLTDKEISDVIAFMDRSEEHTSELQSRGH